MVCVCVFAFKLVQYIIDCRRRGICIYTRLKWHIYNVLALELKANTIGIAIGHVYGSEI